MESKQIIIKALKNFKAKAETYEQTEKYYAGKHDLSFASAKFKNTFGELFRAFSLNLCPAVCDALKDKLRITGFGMEAGDASHVETAQEIWKRNRMPVRADEVHKQATRNGDAYVIVWTDPEGEVTIYPQKAQRCTIEYDEETPGKVLWAAKHWKTPDKKIRLNLYFSDRLEKFISKNTLQSGLPENADAFEEFKDGDSETNIVEHEYEIVPVFHFANNTDIGSFGLSELCNAIPVQNALNKSVLDMLVAMEFAAFRQRWASGIEIDYDKEGNAKPPFTAGVERLWVSENPEVKFGDFDAADLEQFLKVKDSFRTDIAIITFTPLYYFKQAGANFPSGESLKKSETPFTNKVTNRQESFGQTWADVMSFAVALENNKSSKDVRLSVKWQDPAPVSEKENLENISIKKDSLGISVEQAQKEANYGEADIKRMAKENADRQKEKTDNLVNAFNAGEE